MQQKDITRNKEKKENKLLPDIDRWKMVEKSLNSYTNHKRKRLTSRRRLLWKWTTLQIFCVVWAQSRGVWTKCEMKIKMKTGLLGFVWSKSMMKFLNKGTELRDSMQGFEFRSELIIGTEYSDTNVFRCTISGLCNGYICTLIYIIYVVITLYFIISN